MDKIFNTRNTVILVTLLTLWRLYLSAGLQLHPDEAYYWLWSRKLDIGYFDHSPMVAYFIWLTTLISNAELWVRLSGTVVTLLSSLLMWRLAMQLFGSSRVAAGSVMLFNVYPMTMMGLIVITPDIPVFLFWSISIYLFWQIIEKKKIWLWYVLGLTFGLALLSKYTAILLLPCFFIYLLLTDDRRWLKTIHPYLALFAGLLCFFPVVYWNSRHEWISFVFQLGHGLGGQEYSLGRVADYIVGQLLLVGPIAWLLGIYAAFAWMFRKDKAILFLILTSLPVILFFGVSSLKKLAGPNWPAFAYFTFSILAAKYLLDSRSKIRRTLWYAALLTSLLLSTIVTLHAKFSVIPLAKFSRELAVADTTNWFYGWRELGVELMKYPDMAFALSPSHQLSAEMIYYTHEKFPVQTDETARPSQFNLWEEPHGRHGKNGLYVWSDGDSPAHYEKYFSTTSNISTLNIIRGETPIRSYSIVKGERSLIPPLPKL